MRQYKKQRIAASYSSLTLTVPAARLLLNFQLFPPMLDKAQSFNYNTGESQGTQHSDEGVLTTLNTSQR